MNDFLQKKLIDMAKPMLRPAISNGQVLLKKYLDEIPREEGETHSTVLIDFDQSDNILLVVAVFKGATYSRQIAVFTGEDLLNLINTVV
jgi:hypothetical protein